MKTMKISIKREQNDASISSAEREKFGTKFKTFKLFSMAALALVMAACSNDDNVLETAQPAETGKIHFTATLPAPGSGAATRTTFTPDKDDEEKDIITVAWKEGDEIALCHNDTKDIITLAAADINTNGSVTISAYITASDDEDVTVVYPAASVTSVSGVTPTYAATDMSAQDGTLAYIATNLDKRVGSGKLAVSGGNASFKSQISMNDSEIAIWKLTLQDNAATPAAISATKVTLKNGETVIAATSTLATATSSVYLAVPAVTGANLTITATTASGDYSYSKSGVSLTACTYYQSTVTMAAPAPSVSLTNPALGQVIGSDGKNYAANATLPTGVEKVAVIVYLNGTSGLALALNDAGQMSWADANTAATNATPKFSNATWRVPTTQDWWYIFGKSGTVNTDGSVDSSDLPGYIGSFFLCLLLIGLRPELERRGCLTLKGRGLADI